jgi:hypothetical protein
MSMSYCQWENAASALDQCLDTFEEEGQAMVDEIVEGKKEGYPHEYDSLLQMKGLATRFLDMYEAHTIPENVKEMIER